MSSPYRPNVVHVTTTTMNVADLIVHISKPMPVQMIMECGCKALFGAANWCDDKDAGDMPVVDWRGPIYTWCEFHSANQCEDNAVRKALRELVTGLSRGDHH